MAEIVKITKNQPFLLYVPLVILNSDGSKTPVEAESLTDLQVQVVGGCFGGDHEVEYTEVEHYLVLSIPGDLIPTEYAVIISATLPEGRQFTLRNKRAFEIVNWDFQSNWRDYLVDDHIIISDQQFIAGNGVIVPVEPIPIDELDELLN